jgi:hypothetical protein
LPQNYPNNRTHRPEATTAEMGDPADPRIHQLVDVAENAIEADEMR